MRCLDFHERLQEMLDGEAWAEAPPDVQVHLRACEACRELYDAAWRLYDGLLRIPSIAPPLSFTEKVVQNIWRDRRRILRRQWLVRAAAAVLAAGVSFWLTSEIMRKPDSPSFVATTKPEQTPLLKASSPSPPPSLRAELREVSSATLNLTKRVADQTTAHAGLLAPPVEWLSAAPLAPSVQPPMLPVRDVGRTVSDGFEPVASSAQRAWDMFLRELPAEGDEQQPGL